jgi:hypothetical protein
MFLTNKLREDGFGAQYQTIIFTILYCHLENYEFVYRPFEKMEHNYGFDTSFLEKKENLINIKNNYLSYFSVQKNQILDIDLNEIYTKVENNIDYCVNTEPFLKIKNLFLKNKNKSGGEKYASIHIRRPNKFDIGDYGYTSDDYFLNAINKIKTNHPEIKKIKIYSQGEKENFSNFFIDDVELHLNESVEATFTDLVFSDILILYKSSLSYCAGLLCSGVVYYLPFWHKPLKKWKIF